MKKIVATMIVLSFLMAGCTPAAMRAAVLGGTLGTVAVLGLGSALTHGSVAKTSIEAKRDVDMRALEVQGTQGGYTALGGKPGRVELQTSDMRGEKATLTYNTLPPQPTTLEEASHYGFLPRQQNNSDDTHSSSGGNSELYRAGQEAAQNGVRIECATNNDYCRGYNAAMKRR